MRLRSRLSAHTPAGSASTANGRNCAADTSATCVTPPPTESTANGSTTIVTRSPRMESTWLPNSSRYCGSSRSTAGTARRRRDVLGSGTSSIVPARAPSVGVMEDWQIKAEELVRPAFERGDATGWFDQLYSAGAAGEVSMPWDRDEPHALLRDWSRRERVKGRGKSAVVVGCGLGADAEYISSLRFDTVGFDVSPTALQVARERHPESPVDYRVADLLDLPEEWRHAFDLVVEVFTLQALPDPPRGDAARAIAGLVAPGGRLLAVWFRATGDDDPLEGPPFSLTRESVDSLAVDGLEIVSADELELDGAPRWRVEYTRS